MSVESMLSPARSLGDESALAGLADDPGVHVVYRPGGRALYVGLSGSTRSRVRMHLTGDREASILHEKVGRILDKELGRTATREEIRAWLERCTFRVTYTEDTRQVKAALINELSPELNEVTPKVD
ncbi:hypothetical protein [uncultured Phycicoccus sp.]|uniref:hypothetical protein n=1 Tax=uncultured Phycicoccus sp. TaxID=661422 RepID=UPI0026316FED|nr:hypothetical protein [uncultured Phycicoccus sp.]